MHDPVCLIGGEAVATERTLPVIDPSTGSETGAIARGAAETGRTGLHQQLRRRRRRRVAFRRGRRLGPWPRKGLRGTVRFFRPEDGGDPTWEDAVEA